MKKTILIIAILIICISGLWFKISKNASTLETQELFNGAKADAKALSVNIFEEEIVVDAEEYAVEKIKEVEND